MRSMVCKGIAVGCLMPPVLFQNDDNIHVYQLERYPPIPVYFVYKEKTLAVTTFLHLVKDYFKQR